MFFQQFYLQGLGHASYLVGSDETGEALVFDPQRDVSGYFEAVRLQGLRIRYAADSHGHNDYLSGLGELTQRGDVELWGSAEADLGYHHRPLRHGEVIELGDVGIEVLHTPGHTPEHISLAGGMRAWRTEAREIRRLPRSRCTSCGPGWRRTRSTSSTCASPRNGPAAT